MNSQLDDLKPTRLHWAFLLGFVATTVVGVLVFLVQPASARDGKVIYLAGLCWGSLNIALAMSLGGLRKLWIDWRDRNFYGNYRVWLRGKVNDLDFSYVNHKDLPNVLMPGWSLYVPLGGWFKRPFLSHDFLFRERSGRSSHFRIIRVWGPLGYPIMVLVGDCQGNRMVMSIASLLRECNNVYPNGEKDPDAAYSLSELKSRIENSLRREKNELQRKLQDTAGDMTILRTASSLALIELGNLKSRIDRSDRLKNTREGKQLYEEVIRVIANLQTKVSPVQGVIPPRGLCLKM